MATLPEEDDDSEESELALEDESDEEDEAGAPLGSVPADVLAAMQVVREAERSGIDVYAAYRTAKVQQRGKFKARGFFKGKDGRPGAEDRQKDLDQAKATARVVPVVLLAIGDAILSAPSTRRP